MLTGLDIRLPVLVARPVFRPELGQFLLKHRAHSLRWTQSLAAAKAKRLGLTHVNRANIIALEQGRLKHPRRELIAEVATLYTLDTNALWQMVAGPPTSINETEIIAERAFLLERHRTFTVTLGQIQTLVHQLQKALDSVTLPDRGNVIESASSQHPTSSQGDAADDAAQKNSSRAPQPAPPASAEKSIGTIAEGLAGTGASFNASESHGSGDGLRTPKVDEQRDARRSRRRRKNA